MAIRQNLSPSFDVQITAQAGQIAYEIATGIVTLTGEADVVHPQYHISGEVLVYDLNLQHFQGSGDDQEGRIRIRMNPEVIPEDVLPETAPANGPPAAAEESG